MTHEELQAIKARAEAATPGPWRVDAGSEARYLRAEGESGALMSDTQYYPWTPDAEGDWQFIAHARTDVPDLVAEVERLRVLAAESATTIEALIRECGGADPEDRATLEKLKAIRTEDEPQRIKDLREGSWE